MRLLCSHVPHFQERWGKGVSKSPVPLLRGWPAPCQQALHQLLLGGHPPAHPPAASCPSPGQSPWPGPRSHPHSPAALPSHFPSGVLAGPTAPQGPGHSSLLPGCSCLLAAVPRPPPPCLTATEKVDSHKRRSQGRRSHLLIPSGRSMSFPLSLRQVAAWLRPCSLPQPSRQPVLLLTLR